MDEDVRNGARDPRTSLRLALATGVVHALLLAVGMGCAGLVLRGAPASVSIAFFAGGLFAAEVTCACACIERALEKRSALLAAVLVFVAAFVGSYVVFFQAVHFFRVVESGTLAQALKELASAADDVFGHEVVEFGLMGAVLSAPLAVAVLVRAWGARSLRTWLAGGAMLGATAPPFIAHAFARARDELKPVLALMVLTAGASAFLARPIAEWGMLRFAPPEEPEERGDRVADRWWRSDE